MIVLHQYPRRFGMPNASSFCMKVETYLRLAKLPYEIAIISNPRKTPKGKGPFITDGEHVVPDSHFILRYLKDRYGDPLGEGLSAADRARHHAIERMIEEHLYFTLVYIRWQKPANVHHVRDAFLGGMPAPMRNIVFRFVQRDVARSLRGQGIGRHSEAEIESLAIEDLRALAALLGERPYFGGDRPREVDCVTLSNLVAFIFGPTSGPAEDAARALPNLVAYTRRLMGEVFPDFPLAKVPAAA